MPLYKFAADDGLGTELYVQASSGDVSMLTTSRQRLFAYLGVIPHWLYFTPLRVQQPLWYDIMVWTSTLACVLAVIGIVHRLHQAALDAAVQALDRHSLRRLDALALHHRHGVRRHHADLRVQRPALDGALSSGRTRKDSRSSATCSPAARSISPRSRKWNPPSGTA